MTVLRRAIYFAGLVVGLSLVPAVGMTAQPCPPPQFSVEGGSSVATNCGVAVGSSYSTNFPATENPISEGGKWINGKVVGLDWNNIQTIPGQAHGAVFIDVNSRYSDPIAHLNTAFTENQYAQGTVHRVPGYSPPDKHEVELLLRFQITAHNARGYEILWAHAGPVVIVRWNGPVGDYTEIGRNDNAGAAVEGDVLRAEIVGTTINVFKNGTLILTTTNPTWATGQPGMGFWPLPGGTLASYGWRNFQAGSL